MLKLGKGLCTLHLKAVLILSVDNIYDLPLLQKKSWAHSLNSLFSSAISQSIIMDQKC